MAVYATILCVAILFPIVSVLVGYWCWQVTLPTLTFISFTLLFFGGFFCYPFGAVGDRAVTAPSNDVRSEGAILLIVGQASGLAVLILFFVRLFSQGIQFSWL